MIFPLTDGENILDTLSQMQDLLLLLDHGYHFESISRYITDHPELFPEIIEKRINMFDDDDEFDDEFDDDNEDDNMQE